MMRILFVRHATAEDYSNSKDDLSRELTEEGRKKAARAFRGLAQLYDKVDVILTSKAARACQTAKILAEAFTCRDIRETAGLNPGCTYGSFRKVIREYAGKNECLAIVGHEPDFSRLIGEIAGDGMLRINVKKASCIELEMNTLCKGELIAVIPPRIASAIRKNAED